MHGEVRQNLQKYVGHYSNCLTNPCSSCVRNRQQNSVLETINVGNCLLITFFLYSFLENYSILLLCW